MKKRKSNKHKREPKGTSIAYDIETYPYIVAYSKHKHNLAHGRSVEIPSAEFAWNLSPKED